MKTITVKRNNCSMSLEYDPDFKIPLQDLLCDLEKATIGIAISLGDGIKARAADRLCLKRTTLIEKAKKYGFPLRK